MCSNENSKANVLLIGAGGIGCELLKNLVLSGYHNVHIIDLDTIDVSNLNRQFLFRKKHVGMSKAQVAVQSVLKYNPSVNLSYSHASVFSDRFDLEFFNKFDIVLNALDNQSARKHVNRMCIMSKKPLIESGTAGYLGQVEPIISKVVPELNPPCFECRDRETGKRSYPACTIRNTPSEPVHCVIWSKHLFTHLFGEPEVDDEDVTPDLKDPELQDGENKNGHNETNKSNTITNIWEWAESDTFDVQEAVEKISLRLWRQDILQLLSMRKLWQGRKDRKEPIPITVDDLKASKTAVKLLPNSSSELIDQRKADLIDWLRLFITSSIKLRKNVKSEGRTLVWDKDDTDCMEFVASASILRCYIFNIPNASEQNIFMIKSLAGNIIPAIATTNAIIAGLMIIQADLVMTKQYKELRNIYLHKIPAGNKNQLIAPCTLGEKNDECSACIERNERNEYLLIVQALDRLSLRQFRDEILIQRLGMNEPEVQHTSKRGVIILSNEEEDFSEDHIRKSLNELGVYSGSRLFIEDFRQDYAVNIRVKLVTDSNNKENVRNEVMKILAQQDYTLIGEINAESIPSDAKFALIKTRSSNQKVGVKREAQISSENEEKVDNPLKRIKVSDLSDEDDLIMCD